MLCIDAHRMRIALLHNVDHLVRDGDPGQKAREDVIRVAAAVQDALAGRADVQMLGLGKFGAELARLTERPRPDVVINLCESLAADSRGEMAIPALLDAWQLPYTGSGPLGLGLCLHKDKAKELLRARGVSTPDAQLIETSEALRAVTLAFPLMVKPSREDASMGIDFDSVVTSAAGLRRAVERVWKTFDQAALVEQYIEGREVYVPLLGNAPRLALPLTEIRFGPAFAGKPNILSYRAKWEESSAEWKDSTPQPCTLPQALQARCIETAQAAFTALGCRDYGRVDLRVREDGSCFVIDINPNCDLHPQAGFARAALAAGLTYPELIWALVELALERTHGHQPRSSPPSRAAGATARTDRYLLERRGGVRARAHRSRAAAD